MKKEKKDKILRAKLAGRYNAIRGIELLLYAIRGESSIIPSVV